MLLWTRMLLVEELEICFEDRIYCGIECGGYERKWGFECDLDMFDPSKWVNRVPFKEVENTRGRPNLGKELRD